MVDWGNKLGFLSRHLCNVINIPLLPALMVEGLYLWGGYVMSTIGIACLMGVLFASMNQPPERSYKYTLVALAILSFMVILANYTYLANFVARHWLHEVDL